MHFTLRHWTKPGRAERVYLNDYAPGTIYVERTDDGFRVVAPPGIEPDQVLADIRTLYDLPDMTWQGLVGASGLPAPPGAPRRPAARAPNRLPQPAPGRSALGDTLLAVTLAGRPLPSPIELMAAPTVPEAMASMLGRVRNLALVRTEPPLCDLALPDRLAFRLSTWEAIAKNTAKVLEEARARDERYAVSFLVVTGDLAELRDGIPAVGIALADLTAQTRTTPVTALSDAHAGFMIACHLREALV